MALESPKHKTPIRFLTHNKEAMALRAVARRAIKQNHEKDNTGMILNQRKTKKRNKKLFFILISLTLVIAVFLIEILPFLTDGLDFIEDHKNRYHISNSRFDEPITLGLLSDEVKISGVTFRTEFLDCNNRFLRVFIVIKDDIGYFSGAIASWGYPFSTIPSDDGKTGSVYFSINGTEYKCRGYGEGGTGKRGEFSYIVGLELPEGVGEDFSDAEVILNDFFLVKYQLFGGKE